MLEVKDALQRVISGDGLERAEMAGLMGRLMDGELSEAQKAALLAALAVKGETAAEIAGAADALRQRVVTIPLVADQVEDIVDTCGTGGDGKGTFNISTAAALVAASAGVPIAKHGNRSISSRSGSADVLEALGVRVEATPEEAARSLARNGLCFLFAPNYHPAMREVMPVRRELGVRTLFNLLGPLTNPAGARRQLMGIYSKRLVETVARVLAELGTKHALVVHGSDGLDELTLTGSTRIAEVRDGGVESRDFHPEEVGIELCTPDDLVGGEPSRNAALMRRVLDNKPGPLTDVTALNAGAAIYVGGRAESIAEGVGIARQALEQGAARAKLEELLRADGEAS